MKIETERLEIIPLTVEQLELWINNIQQLEKELKCYYRAEPVRGIFKDVIQSQLAITKNDVLNYIWHSFWFIIRKIDRTVVGSFDFKDVINTNGEVEIGYGLGKSFEHNGYMTEAIEAICNWISKQDNAKYIIAETELNNFASQNVLKSCNFFEYHRNETIWWKYKILGNK